MQSHKDDARSASSSKKFNINYFAVARDKESKVNLFTENFSFELRSSVSNRNFMQYILKVGRSFVECTSSLLMYGQDFEKLLRRLPNNFVDQSHETKKRRSWVN